MARDFAELTIICAFMALVLIVCGLATGGF